MSRQPGFVPVNFILAGRILLGIGIAGLLVFALAELTGWFALPTIVPIIFLVIIIVGLYMMFIVPRNEQRRD